MLGPYVYKYTNALRHERVVQLKAGPALVEHQNDQDGVAHAVNEGQPEAFFLVFVHDPAGNQAQNGQGHNRPGQDGVDADRKSVV